jgi:DNA invertase Pin-like site-specific DNA recombinase
MRVTKIEPAVRAEPCKKRVCAYARVSTGKYQQEESLENQIQYYKKLITSNPEYEFAGVFSDSRVTGTKDDRFEFNKMLELCRQRKIDLIITKSISRLARNTAIVLRYVRELKEIGVEVRFEKENISTLSQDGELMLTVLSSFAEEESRSVSENVKWRYRKKFERGELVINTKRFLGYDMDEYGDLIINADEAEIVRRIYEEYLAGNGSHKIAKLLNIEGVPTVTGSKWNKSSILDILRNEKYMGDVMLQKTYIVDHLSKKKRKNTGEVDSFYIEDNHSPIVPKEVWLKVQIEMKKRAAEKGILGNTDKYTNRYPLSGMLYCGKCGTVMKRRTWNSGHNCKKIVWQCGNYIENGKVACSGTKIDNEIAEKLNISEPTIVKEEVTDGKKHYSYTCKGKQKEYAAKH